MRLIYLDEAGISAAEPVLVVGGFIADVDHQWKEVQTYIRSLVEEYIPEENRENFSFHATELFSGGKFFNRTNWSKQKRWEILKRVLEIPSKLNLPIVYGYCGKNYVTAARNDPAPVRAVIFHLMAFTACTIAAESFMRKNTAGGEMAMLIVEDNAQARKYLKDTHRILRNQQEAEKLGKLLPKSMHEYLPVERIMDTVHFASKADSTMLQVADACTFVAKRYLSKASHGEEFFEVLAPGHKPERENAGGFTYIRVGGRKI